MEYTSQLESEIRAWVQEQMKPKRFPHVEGVVATAEKLAQQYAPDDVMRCRIAAWLHDAAKHWDDDDLLAYAGDHGEPITPFEHETPMLLHGVVGYLIGADRFGLDDPVIKAACAAHTTGAPDMGVVEKIVFLADLIEPGRDFPSVEAIRAEAEHDLDAAILSSLDHTIRYMLDKGRKIDPRPILLRNELIKAGVTYNIEEQ